MGMPTPDRYCRLIEIDYPASAPRRISKRLSISICGVNACVGIDAGIAKVDHQAPAERPPPSR
jgi:hypothetical protein